MSSVDQRCPGNVELKAGYLQFGLTGFVLASGLLIRIHCVIHILCGSCILFDEFPKSLHLCFCMIER